ncbi:MAG: Stp1/IreP family PP2C-type Ser/Thr phosphatase [Pseudomonadota bacterium]
MEFKYFGFSDVGKSRNKNEDSYLCSEKEKLFVVADGIGGHASGNTASQLAVKSLEEFVIKSRGEVGKRPKQLREGLTLEQNRLLAGALFANKRVYDAAHADPEKRGMGTTLVGVIVDGDHLAVVNVGDSRLYRVRDREIEQITQDHSLVGEQTRKGLITEEDAKKHPQRNILTSALGVYKKPEIDVSRLEILPEDLFLICSDGLYHMIDNRKILENIKAIDDRSLYKIGLSLVLEANLAGGKDNITVILLEF